MALPTPWNTLPPSQPVLPPPRPPGKPLQTQLAQEWLTGCLLWCCCFRDSARLAQVADARQRVNLDCAAQKFLLQKDKHAFNWVQKLHLVFVSVHKAFQKLSGLRVTALSIQLQFSPFPNGDCLCNYMSKSSSHICKYHSL